MCCLALLMARWLAVQCAGNFKVTVTSRQCPALICACLWGRSRGMMLRRAPAQLQALAVSYCVVMLTLTL